MSQILKLTHENQQLKRQINQYQQVLGVSPYVDDSLLKGGYRVVKTIADRDAIKCCWRKQGMKVVVIGEDLFFKEYVLKSSNCKENVWEEINLTVEENEVFLTEDYSELEENLTTQKELNLVLKQLILNLQTSLNNKLHKGTYTGTAQDLKNDIDSKANISHTHDISSITNLQNSLDTINNDINNLEGINYVWSPTNRTLTLYDNNGTQLSQVSLVSLDNEGTDIRYNASTLSLELYNADNELLDSIPISSFIGSVGTQLQLNSNELQLKDSQGNILSTVSFTVSNIQGLQTALDAKLNKPTITGNTTTYPYVVGEDGNGNSARLPAGDLGKNFFNSDLSNTTARNHTMNAGITVNTLGNPHTLSGLPNKNTDIANFRKVRVQNASGLDAVVDSKNMLLDMPSYLTEQERTNWKTAMNGGWTTNTMSISTIVPFLIPFGQDVNTTVFITGANLNLLPTTFTVEILDINNNVVATVPNNQVNLVNSGNLNFYFNFKNLPIAEYKIRLWNGVAYYTSVPKFKIVDVSNITNIDFGLAGWDVLKQATDTTTQVYGNSLNIAEVGTANSLVTSLLSGKFAEANENFVIELVVQASNKNTHYPNAFFKIGLTDGNVANSLVSNQFLFYGLGKTVYDQVLIRYLNSGQGIYFANSSSTSNYSLKLTIIKQDNQLILIDPLGNGSFTTLINSSGYKLSVQMVATGNSELFGVNIISAYKF